uniref:Uncharacterized protein n=1 Tax=Plectus sambesii TaxID=2011161 RepID=A0A914UGE1_9BILA
MDNKRKEDATGKEYIPENHVALADSQIDVSSLRNRIRIEKVAGSLFVFANNGSDDKEKENVVVLQAGEQWPSAARELDDRSGLMRPTRLFWPHGVARRMNDIDRESLATVGCASSVSSPPRSCAPFVCGSYYYNITWPK